MSAAFKKGLILWQVNPLLGNEMLNELPRRQTLDKQSVLGYTTVERGYATRFEMTS
jgi:hypothetical protein